MQAEPAADRETVRESATTKWEGSLFSPSTNGICYCGAAVASRFLCAVCSERMSRALQRPLLDEPRLEGTG